MDSEPDFPERPRNATPHRKIAAVIALLAGFGILIAAVVLTTLSAVGVAGDKLVLMPEVTCEDFNSWPEASRLFDSLEPQSDQRLVLDSNGNGIPCEGILPNQRPDHEMFEVVCDDFQHRDEAEYFFEAYDSPEENLFGLDRDIDGRPCETLPPLDRTLRVLNRLNRIWSQDAEFGGDANCSDFETWVEANQFFIQAGGPDSDPHRLDGNNNGIPCQSLPGAP